jgi:hypothetical protein
MKGTNYKLEDLEGFEDSLKMIFKRINFFINTGVIVLLLALVNNALKIIEVDMIWGTLIALLLFGVAIVLFQSIDKQLRNDVRNFIFEIRRLDLVLEKIDDPENPEDPAVRAARIKEKSNRINYQI